MGQGASFPEPLSRLTRRPRSTSLRSVKHSCGFLAALWAAGTAWSAEPVPDFKLKDENTKSLRYTQQVSPRDYVLQVSGYYFGAAS